MMRLIMLLSDVFIVPNLMTPPLYLALHCVLDGSCDDGIDQAVGWCAPCYKSRDTATL
jgi:hypothetical protein